MDLFLTVCGYRLSFPVVVSHRRHTPVMVLHCWDSNVWSPPGCCIAVLVGCDWCKTQLCFLESVLSIHFDCLVLVREQTILSPCILGMKLFLLFKLALHCIHSCPFRWFYLIFWKYILFPKRKSNPCHSFSDSLVLHRSVCKMHFRL